MSTHSIGDYQSDSSSSVYSLELPTAAKKPSKKKQPHSIVIDSSPSLERSISISTSNDYTSDYDLKILTVRPFSQQTLSLSVQDAVANGMFKREHQASLDNLKSLHANITTLEAIHTNPDSFSVRNRYKIIAVAGTIVVVCLFGAIFFGAYGHQNNNISFKITAGVLGGVALLTLPIWGYNARKYDQEEVLIDRAKSEHSRAFTRHKQMEQIAYNTERFIISWKKFDAQPTEDQMTGLSEQFSAMTLGNPTTPLLFVDAMCSKIKAGAIRGQWEAIKNKDSDLPDTSLEPWKTLNLPQPTQEALNAFRSTTSEEHYIQFLDELPNIVRRGFAITTPPDGVEQNGVEQEEAVNSESTEKV